MGNSKAFRATAVVMMLGLLFAAQARAASVWVEGEGANIKMVQPSATMDDVKTDALSGGAWASNLSAQRAGVLDYRFQVPQAGDYTFFLRACPVEASPHLQHQRRQVDGRRLQQAYRPDQHRLRRQVRPARRRLAGPGHGHPPGRRRQDHLPHGEPAGQPRRHRLLPVHHRDVHAEGHRTSGRRRRPARAAAGDGRLALPARPGHLQPRRPAGPALPQREGGRRARLHQALGGRQRLRARRRAAHPLLGGQHVHLGHPDPRADRRPRPVPGQARRQHGALARQHHAEGQELDARATSTRTRATSSGATWPT